MIWVWGRIKDQRHMVPCISLLLFKPSHTYTASDLTTDRVTTMNKNHNYLPDCHLSGLNDLTPQTWVKWLYPWKSWDSRTAVDLVGSWVSSPNPFPRKAQLWNHIRLLRALRSQGMKPCQDGDGPTSLGLSSTAGLSPWGKDFPNQLLVFQRLSEHHHDRKAFMATKTQDISLSDEVNNVTSKSPYSK